MSRVFISYRRDDSKWIARALKDRLCEELGSKQVFMDVDSIEPGLDFVDVIEQAVSKVDVVLAIIGKNWLNASNEHGKRRLDNPEDFVRVEIATALNRGIRLIPLLERGALMPTPDELPEDLQPLTRRNAIEISDIGFADDVNRLLGTLRRILEIEKQRKSGTATSMGIDPKVLEQAAHEASLKTDLVQKASPKPAVSSAPQPVAPPAPQPVAKVAPAAATNRQQTPAVPKKSRAKQGCLLVLLLFVVLGFGAVGAEMFSPGILEEMTVSMGQVEPPPEENSKRQPVAGSEPQPEVDPQSAADSKSTADAELAAKLASSVETPRDETTSGEDDVTKESPGEFEATGVSTEPPAESPATKDDSAESNDSPQTKERLRPSMSSHPTVQTKVTPTGAVTGVVFEDLNGDGKQDAGERGLAGVKLVITGSSGDPHAAITSSEGKYELRIATGKTQVAVAENDPKLPTGAALTTKVDEQPFNLTSDQAVVRDYGFQKQGIVEGIVFKDENDNGKQDDDEPGLPDVEVMVVKSDGSKAKLVTDEHGLYCVMVPIGKTGVTLSGQLNGGGAPEGASPITVDVPAGGKGIQDIGLSASRGLLVGRVFEDSDGDGVQGESEKGIANVRVGVLRAGESVAAWKLNPVYMTSDQDGNCQFRALPGKCTLAVDTSSLVAAGSSLTTPGFDSVEVVANEESSFSFGFQQLGTIAGIVFHDTNRNGLRDNGEKGVANVALHVKLPDGTARKLSTNAAGKFETKVVPGESSIDVPSKGSAQLEGVVANVKLPHKVVVAAGHTTTGDVAFVKPLTLKGIVFNDKNGNGLQDAAEKGIQDVKMKIRITEGETHPVITDQNGGYEIAVLKGHKAKLEIDPKQPALAGAKQTKEFAEFLLASNGTTTVSHGFRKPSIVVNSKGKSYADYEKLMAQAKKEGVSLLVVLEFERFTVFQPQSEGGKAFNLVKGDKLEMTSLNSQHRVIWVANVERTNGSRESVRAWIPVDVLSSTAAPNAQPNAANQNNPQGGNRQIFRNLPNPFRGFR